MPYIETITTAAISKRRELAIKERMGQAICLIPGKSEDWLMLSFRDNTPMYFHGDESEDCAMCSVKLFGSTTPEVYEKLTGALTDILHQELELEPSRIYIAYQEIDTWGWNGGNF